MKHKIWSNLRKYFKRSKSEINNCKIVKEIPFHFLTQTSDVGFKFISTLSKEVRNKCAEMGYEVDHIYMFTSYDAPLLFVNENIKSGSDDYLAICQRDNGNCFCAVFLGSWIEVK